MKKKKAKKKVSNSAKPVLSNLDLDNIARLGQPFVWTAPSETNSTSDIEKACRAMVKQSRDEVLRGIASAMDEAAEAIKSAKISKPTKERFECSSLSEFTKACELDYDFKTTADLKNEQKRIDELDELLKKRTEEMANGECEEVADVRDLGVEEDVKMPAPLTTPELPLPNWRPTLFSRSVPEPPPNRQVSGIFGNMGSSTSISTTRPPFFDDLADIGLRVFSFASLAIFGIRFYIERFSLRSIPKWEWVLGLYFLILVSTTAYKDIRGKK